MNKTIEEYEDILSSIKKTQRELEEVMALRMIVKLLYSFYNIVLKEKEDENDE